jgi:hypothetical protein
MNEQLAQDIADTKEALHHNGIHYANEDDPITLLMVRYQEVKHHLEEAERTLRLERFPIVLNQKDSQSVRDERVCWH